MGPFSQQYVRYYNFANHLNHLYKELPNNEELLGEWHYGCNGGGKSTYIYKIAIHNFGSFYTKETNKWWDGYNDEPVFIIEYINPERANVLIRDLIRWFNDNSS